MIIIEFDVHKQTMFPGAVILPLNMGGLPR